MGAGGGEGVATLVRRSLKGAALTLSPSHSPSPSLLLFFNKVNRWRDLSNLYKLPNFSFFLQFFSLCWKSGSVENAFHFDSSLKHKLMQAGKHQQRVVRGRWSGGKQATYWWPSESNRSKANRIELSSKLEANAAYTWCGLLMNALNAGEMLASSAAAFICAFIAPLTKLSVCIDLWGTNLAKCRATS